MRFAVTGSTGRPASPGMRRRWPAGFGAALLLTGLAATSLAQEAVPGAKKRVVILYSYRTLMPVNADWDRGIRRGLAAGFQGPVDTNIEYLDMARYEHDEEYLRDWIDVLRLKYADRQVDLVMPVYSSALEFSLAHRDALFPGVPIVFCSASRGLAERARGEPDVTGVPFRFDYEGTLRAARDLFPQTRRVLVVCGGSDRDRGFRDEARLALGQYGEELDIDSVEGLPLPQLLEEMAGVAPHTVVLMLVYDKDELGNDYMTQEVAEQLAKVCPAPVFGLYDTLLGHGIVGGSLLMVERQGELAGEMAARVLQGERPSDIPAAGLAANQLLFDARQLHRWGIDEAALPAGSTVRYHEPTFWERYGDYVAAGTLVVVVQTLVIAGLILSRARRRRAERELADRLRFESLLSDLSSRFVHLPARGVDWEITNALGQIGEFLDLDGGSLFRLSADGTEIQAGHSWMAGDGTHAVTGIPLREIPWCWENITRGQVFCFSTLDDLPKEAQRERDLFRRIGLKSAVAIPLSVSESTIGMLAFGCLKKVRNWDEATVQRLVLLGEIFANALAHAQADEALDTSRSEARQLAGRLLTAQEDERRNLAREMHDDLSQRLALAAIDAGKLEQRRAQSSESREALSALKHALIAISDDMHQMSRKVHPAILDDLGLEDTLRSECRDFGERHGCAVQFRCGDLPEGLPKDVALCLYRITQEALRNAAKHAEADHVEVALNADPEFVYLEVRDSGCGFDARKVRDKPGLGLASMEERARLVGGELTVSSTPGTGTSIAVRIPLPEEDE